MNGFVDDQLRALLRIPVSASRVGERTNLVVWIDTAFNGGLAIPRKQVAELENALHALRIGWMTLPPLMVARSSRPLCR